MTRTGPLHYIINADCNPKDAYNFGFGNEAMVGYLEKLTFQSVKVELVADTTATDPENAGNKVKAVAVIQSMNWSGWENDPIRFSGRVSPANFALLREALSALTDSADVEAQWVIYDFDHSEKKYYKRFHTNKKAIKAVIHDNSHVYVSETPYNDYTIKPVNYAFDMSLSPDARYNGQEVAFAYRASKQLTRKFEWVPTPELAESNK